MPQADLDQLSKYLASRNDVICAVVFGSARYGTIREDGDLDLAVYFSDKPRGEAYIQFLVEAAEAAEFDVIDMVDLREADAILAFEALSGRFLCKPDPEKTAELTSLVSREYEDVMFRLSHAA